MTKSSMSKTKKEFQKKREFLQGGGRKNLDLECFLILREIKRMKLEMLILSSRKTEYVLAFFKCSFQKYLVCVKVLHKTISGMKFKIDTVISSKLRNTREIFFLCEEHEINF